MSHVEKHANGSFSWIELGTNNQNAAKDFYTGLFGWTFEDSPMGPNDFYTMFQLGGRVVGAAYTLRPQETSVGVPPHWNLYISVEDADDTAKRAAAAGGKVLAPPFDVYTYGRMAVIEDPTGATFAVWQARDHSGNGVEGEAGALCWADLNTPDQAVAAKFYSELFGWTMPPGDGGYLHIKNGDSFIGGIVPAGHAGPGVPPHWMIYIQVASCENSADKAKKLGAAVCLAPTKVEKAGTMAVLTDPQGASFAVFEPA